MSDNERQALGLIARAYGDVLRRVRKYCGGSWTLNQCLVMHAIHSDYINGQECTVRRLAENEGLSQQTVSNAVAALRKAGMVTEKVHPADGRLRLLTPTEAALELRTRVWSEVVGIPAAPTAEG